MDDGTQFIRVKWRINKFNKHLVATLSSLSGLGMFSLACLYASSIVSSMFLSFNRMNLRTATKMLDVVYSDGNATLVWTSKVRREPLWFFEKIKKIEDLCLILAMEKAFGLTTEKMMRLDKIWMVCGCSTAVELNSTGHGFESRQVQGFFSFFLSVVCPLSGPLRRCNTPDFPIKKICLAKQLEAKQA